MNLNAEILQDPRRRQLATLIGLTLIGMGVPASRAFAADKPKVRLTAAGPGSAETLTIAVLKAYPDLTSALDIE